MNIEFELECEEDGRWIGEAPDLPGVMVYAATPEAAAMRVQALALRCIADRLENGDFVPGLQQITFTMNGHESLAVC